MQHPTPFAATAASLIKPSPDKTAPENSVELIFSKGEATLSAHGAPLIYFRSPVQVGGAEILDWMKQGLLTELVSLENLAAFGGIPITVKEIPDYRAEIEISERSERSLLLNPQWFSIYFITFSEPCLRKMTTGTAHGVDTMLTEVHTRLLAFFEAGKGLADYKNHNVYLRRFRIPRAA